MSNQTIKWLGVKDYFSALDYLNGKSERPCGHNTRIRMESDAIVIRHWSTDIIKYLKHGGIVLDNGGYFTSTTKERYNAFLPDYISVYQEKGKWLIVNRALGISAIWKNGMKINPDGTFEGCADESETKRIEKLTKQINKYAKDFTDKLLKGKIDKPSGGDCWYCCMKTEDGKSLGDVASSDHLLQHLKEKYYVPSILTNIVESGRLCQFDIWTIGVLLGYSDGQPTEFEKDLLKRDLPKQIANYFKDRLDIAR